MENMSVQKFPQNLADIEVDLKHPNDTLFTGLYEEEVKVNDDVRTYLTYLTDHLKNTSPSLIVAPPSDANPAEFIQTSGLKAFADQHKVFLFILKPKDNQWDTSGIDSDYMNEVYKSVFSRRYYVTILDNIYAFGIGDGSVIAQQTCMKSSLYWSGLVTIGDLDMNVAPVENDLKEQLPVWMAISSMSASNQYVVDYWKKYNRVEADFLSGQGADYIWAPTPVRTHNEINNEEVAQVRITLNTTESSFELLNNMWSYIGKLRNHRGYGRRNLRYLKDVNEYGAVHHTLEVDGLTREWYEYVPEECTPDQAWPLVVVMHGRGGSAETFFDITGMANVAKDRHFIAVFPQAGIHQGRPGGIRNIPLWSGEYLGQPIDDVKFIREMVADIEDRHNIDKERIYACGQSSGGMMTDLLGDAAGDIFAAVAPWSGLIAPSIVKMAYPKSDSVTPCMWLYGDHDYMLCAAKEEDPDMPFSIHEALRDTFMAKLDRYGLDPKRYDTWTTDPITWYSFTNEENVPIVVVGVVRDMIHANYPEESWISYDQFLSQFRKDKEGRVYYRGKEIQTKVKQ